MKKKETQRRELWKINSMDGIRIIIATNLEEAIDIFMSVSEYKPLHLDCLGYEVEAPNIFS